MKVLFVIPSLSTAWGGTTTATLGLWNALRDNNLCDVDICTTVLGEEKGYITAEIIEQEHIRFFDIRDPFWRYSREFKQHLVKNINQYDLIHIHGLWCYTTFCTARLAKASSIPYIISPHGMLEKDALNRKKLKKKIYWNLFEKKLLRSSSAIHCITEKEQKSTTSLIKGIPTFVVSNGIDVGNDIKKDLKGKKTIAFIGRLHPIKGLDLLIKAFAKINEELVLFIVGKGDHKYEQYIHSLINELNLNERIKCIGFADTETVKQIFSDSLFTIVPSHSEGMSMVCLESIANSTPILSTKQANFMIAEENGAGITIENNKVESIVDGIKQMMAADLDKMSSNAYTLAKEKFDWNIIAEQMHKHYTEILKVTE